MPAFARRHDGGCKFPVARAATPPGRIRCHRVGPRLLFVGCELRDPALHLRHRRRERWPRRIGRLRFSQPERVQEMMQVEPEVVGPVREARRLDSCAHGERRKRGVASAPPVQIRQPELRQRLFQAAHAARPDTGCISHCDVTRRSDAPHRLTGRKEDQGMRQVAVQRLPRCSCVRVEPRPDRIVELMHALVEDGFEPCPAARAGVRVGRNKQEIAVRRKRARPVGVRRDVHRVPVGGPRYLIRARDEVENGPTFGVHQLLGRGDPGAVRAPMRRPPRFAVDGRDALEHVTNRRIHVRAVERRRIVSVGEPAFEQCGVAFKNGIGATCAVRVRRHRVCPRLPLGIVERLQPAQRVGWRAGDRFTSGVPELVLGATQHVQECVQVQPEPFGFESEDRRRRRDRWSRYARKEHRDEGARGNSHGEQQRGR